MNLAMLLRRSRELIRLCLRTLHSLALVIRRPHGPVPNQPTCTDVIDPCDAFPSGFDDETQYWLRSVLNGAPADHGLHAYDPEAAHDIVRFRGVLIACAAYYAATRAPQAAARITELIQYGVGALDRTPQIGWDTTTTALRLLNLLEACEIIRQAKLPFPVDTDWLDRFLEAHASPLAVGTVLEPAGNHELVNALGFGALHLMLRRKSPLSNAIISRIRIALSTQWRLDGGHVEGVPHYHVQLLAALGLIIAVDRARGGRLGSSLEHLISRPIAAISALMGPDGLPLRFGDASRTFTGRLTCEDIDTIYSRIGSPQSTEANLVVCGIQRYSWRSSKAAYFMAADCNELGHPLNPGHGHADVLSFCFWIDGSPVVVDPGTYLYCSSPSALWFKTAAAHNAIHWVSGPVAVPKRFFRWKRPYPAPCLCHPSTGAGLVAWHTWNVAGVTYVHGRKWLLHDDGLEVRDQTHSSDGEPAVARLNLAPGSRVFLSGPCSATIVLESGRSVKLRLHGPVSALRIADSWYSPRYGLRHASLALTWNIAARRNVICSGARMEVER